MGGGYMKKCKSVGEIGVVECAEMGGGVGIKTEEALAGKRTRQSGHGNSDLTSSDHVEIRRIRRRLVIEAKSCSAPEEVPVEGLTKIVQLRTSAALSGERERNWFESEESRKMESTEGMSWTEARSTVQEIPLEFEIDDFFASSEEYLVNRFSNKYNFDIAKGVPLEGRYEWVPVKP